jgi:hypothetical protein
MTDRIASVDTRILGPRARVLGFSDSDALQNIITTELPNGSLCYVIENQSLYVLHKDSTDTPSGTKVVQPLAGPGRWVLLVSPVDPNLAWQSEVVTGGPPTVSFVDGSTFWAAQPGQFVFWNPFNPTSPFLIEFKTGVMTYVGAEPTNIVVRAQASIRPPESDPVQLLIQLAIDIDGDLIGTDTTTAEAQETTTLADDTLSVMYSVERWVKIEPNQTITGAFRNMTNADDLLIPFMRLSARIL